MRFKLMRLPGMLWCSLICVFVLGFPACSRKEGTDATKPLEQSFQQAAPEVKQTIETVNGQLKNGSYEEALKTLTPIALGKELTAQQKQAIGAALQQATAAAAANPALNTKEMYQVRLKLVQALHERR